MKPKRPQRRPPSSYPPNILSARLPSMCCEPADLARLRDLQAHHGRGASEIVRGLIRREHARLPRIFTDAEINEEIERA